MKNLALHLLISVMVLLLLAVVAYAGTPASEAAEPAAKPSLVDLLPDSTIVAVEFRNLAGKLRDIGEIPAVRKFQDQVLSGKPIYPEELPLLAANRAVFALVGDERIADIIPVILLRPTSMREAEIILSRLMAMDGTGPFAFAVQHSLGAIWITPARASGHLVSLARGNGLENVSNLNEAGEVDHYLPLVRSALSVLTRPVDADSDSALSVLEGLLQNIADLSLDAWYDGDGIRLVGGIGLLER